MKYHIAREVEAMEKAWRVEAGSNAQSVADGLRSTYGFTDQEIGNIGDHRQLLVIRDAARASRVESRSRQKR